MPAMTDELRMALTEFKSCMNSYIFVIDYKNPPFPMGSIESYEAQLNLANEYLAKYPDLNTEEFNYIGTPIYVRDTVVRRIEQENIISDSSIKQGCTQALLWDAYMAILNNDIDERLTVLEKLKRHFDKAGQSTLPES
ncbi:hypothetical protein AB6D11_19150 [Vibrio splendidus]